MGSKETKSTTEVELPPPSPEELALLDQQIEIGAGQLDRIGTAEQFTQRLFQDFLPSLEQLNQFSRQQSRLGANQLDLAQQITDQQGRLFDAGVENALSAGTLTPEQDRLITDATDLAIQSTLSEIGRFRDEGIGELRNELAPSLGLRPSDTPIIDRGQDIVRDANRVAGQQIGNLQSQAAQSRLRLPLDIQRQRGALIGGQQQAGQSTTNFQQTLANEAFNNRLRLTGITGNALLGTAGIGPQASTLPSLQQTRQSAATQTTTEEGGGFLDTLSAVGSLAGGLGGLGTGLDAVGLGFG